MMLVTFLCNQVHVKRHFAFAGEFDGIVQDIEQDLLDPPGIAEKPVGQKRILCQPETDPMFLDLI